jgi:hypothetical protein
MKEHPYQSPALSKFASGICFSEKSSYNGLKTPVGNTVSTPWSVVLMENHEA